MSKHILAVDDEVHIRRLVEVNLQRAGFRVTTAVDGVDALEKIRADRPDMVILDVMMPRKDGFSVLEELRASPETADLPVVILSVRTRSRDVFRGWNAGADCYMTKPFNPTELITFVRRRLETGDPPAMPREVALAA